MTKPIRDRLLEMETKLIEQALKKAEGNVAEAARDLQMSKRTLFYRLPRLDIDPDDYR